MRRLPLFGASFVVLLALAPPLAAQGTPSPMMPGRWVPAPGGKAPANSELQRLCREPAAYVQVTPDTLREVSADTNITCHMPVWTKAGPSRFTATLASCSPAPKGGKEKVTVQLKGMAQMVYNGAVFVMCPTGP